MPKHKLLLGKQLEYWLSAALSGTLVSIIVIDLKKIIFFVKFATTELEINNHNIIVGYNSLDKTTCLAYHCMYNNENLPQLHDIKIPL